MSYPLWRKQMHAIVHCGWDLSNLEDVAMKLRLINRLYKAHLVHSIGYPNDPLTQKVHKLKQVLVARLGEDFVKSFEES